MTLSEIQDLIKLVNRLNLTEFKMKDGEFEIAIRTKLYEKGSKEPKGQTTTVVPLPQTAPPQVPVSPQPQSEAPAPKEPEKAAAESKPEDESNLVAVKSPIVGTFYRSPSPDKPAFVKVGDSIEVGSVVCIVEAMKLFNEIESEVAGKVVKVEVEDASPVEYDQVLFLIDPKG